MFVLYVCTSTNGSVYQLLKYNKTQKSNPRKPESSVPTKFFVHQVRCVLRGQRLHRAGHPARGGGRLPGRQNCPQTQTTARREPGRSNPSKKDKYRRKGKGRRCFLGDVLECRAIHLAARMNLKNNFLKNIYFGRVMVWCELEDHPFFWSIYSAKCPFYYSSISSNPPSAKSVLRHGFEWISSPKQQRWPLPSLLFFKVLFVPANWMASQKSESVMLCWFWSKLI